MLVMTYKQFLITNIPEKTISIFSHRQVHIIIVDANIINTKYKSAFVFLFVKYSETLGTSKHVLFQ